MSQSFYSVKDVPAQDFIKSYAEYLKKNNKISAPKWTEWAKTGKNRELAAYDADWLYVRTAALARKIYLRGHLGVGTLKHIYGGQQRFGSTRNHHSTCSGKVLRFCLQELERIGVVKKDKKHETKKNSRVITKEGQADLNQIATQIAKTRSE